jgi:hypothetical protein
MSDLHKRVLAALETLEYALRDAMVDMEHDMIRFLAKHSENQLVQTAAEDELTRRLGADNV